MQKKKKRKGGKGVGGSSDIWKCVQSNVVMLAAVCRKLETAAGRLSLRGWVLSLGCQPPALAAAPGRAARLACSLCALPLQREGNATWDFNNN